MRIQQTDAARNGEEGQSTLHQHNVTTNLGFRFQIKKNNIKNNKKNDRQCRTALSYSVHHHRHPEKSSLTTYCSTQPGVANGQQKHVPTFFGTLQVMKRWMKFDPVSVTSPDGSWCWSVMPKRQGLDLHFFSSQDGTWRLWRPKTGSQIGNW